MAESEESFTPMDAEPGQSSPAVDVESDPGKSPVDPSQVSSVGETTLAEVSSSTIDSLPDAVLSAILSKLCEAKLIAQAATVSRRWRTCSTGVDTLLLDLEDLDNSDDDESSSSSSSCSACELDVQTMREVYDRMVTNCTGLRRLTLRSFRCLRRAMKDAFETSLRNSHHSLEHLELLGDFDLDSRLVNGLSRCLKLESLHLQAWDYKVSRFDVNQEVSSQFSSLKKCVLKDLNMGDGTLEHLVVLAPRLEELEAMSLSLESPKIVAANLRRLTVEEAKCVNVDAPKLEFLDVIRVAELHADGDALAELRVQSLAKLVFKRTPRLKALKLYGTDWCPATISKCLDMAKSAEEIVLQVSNGWEAMCFPEVFDDFTELKKLELGMSVVESLQERMVEIQSLPSLTSISIESSTGNSKTVAMVSAILERSSSLSSFVIALSDRPGGTFCTELFKLQARYNKVAMKLEVMDEEGFDEYEHENDEDYDEDEEVDDFSDEDSHEDDDDDDEDDDDDDDDEDDEDHVDEYPDFNLFIL